MDTARFDLHREPVLLIAQQKRAADRYLSKAEVAESFDAARKADVVLSIVHRRSYPSLYRVLALLAAPLVLLAMLVAPLFGVHFCPQEAMPILLAAGSLPFVGPLIERFRLRAAKAHCCEPSHQSDPVCSNCHEPDRAGGHPECAEKARLDPNHTLSKCDGGCL